MSKAGRITYHFVQGSSLEDLNHRGEPLCESGWERVGNPRAVEVNVPGRGVKVCYSQTFALVVSAPRCQRVPASGVGACQPVSSCDHFVQIYDSDDALLDQLEDYVRSALTNGESAIVIATPEHRAQLNERLNAAGLDAAQPPVFGRLFSLDAAGLISQFMKDGLPDETLFHDAIGAVLQSARRGGRTVRAYGEMVAILWAEGKRAAALKLEELWHPLCQREQFPLFCAYPKSGFVADNFEGLGAVCAAHSRVF